MTHFGDPQFIAHQALGRVWVRMAMAIATSPLLPYHPIDYAIRLNETYLNLIQEYGAMLNKNNVTTGLANVGFLMNNNKGLRTGVVCLNND